MTRDAHAIEDRITEAAKRRIIGRHVELYAVVMTGVQYAPEVEQAVRARMVLEQETLKKKLQLESAAANDKLDLLIEQRKEQLHALEEAREAQKRALEKAHEEKSDADKTSGITVPRS